MMDDAGSAVRRTGSVRFVALDRQHARIEGELKAAFVRLLGSSAFTLGSAQAHDARYKDPRAGSFGAAAGFSFYPQEPWSARRRRCDHVELGYNERLDGLQAALLRVNSSTWSAGMSSAEHARRATGSCSRPRRRSCTSVTTVHASSTCLVRASTTAMPSRRHFGRRESTPQFTTRPRCTGTRRGKSRRCVTASRPTGKLWAARELSLPMHPDLTTMEVDRVVEAAHDAVSVKLANRQGA